MQGKIFSLEVISTNNVKHSKVISLTIGGMKLEIG